MKLTWPDHDVVLSALEAALAHARQQFEQRGIPADALVLNIAWMTDAGDQFSFASPTPENPPPNLAVSLRQSAWDVERVIERDAEYAERDAAWNQGPRS